MKRPGLHVLIFVLALFAYVGCAPARKSAAPLPRRFDPRKVFAPSDCFELEVRGYPYEFSVSKDGTVEWPLVPEPVKVAGLRPDEVVKLFCRLYKPGGPREAEVEVMPCFKAMSATERAEAKSRVEHVAKEAARKRGWRGELKTIVLMSAPYQRAPETGDRWIVEIWEENQSGTSERSALVVISVDGKVISFARTSPQRGND